MGTIGGAYGLDGAVALGRRKSEESPKCTASKCHQGMGDLEYRVRVRAWRHVHTGLSQRPPLPPVSVGDTGQ